MVGDSPDSPQRWTAKRRAALILSVLTGETSSLALVRKHVAKRCSQACRELRAKLFAEFGHGSAAPRHVRSLQGLEDVRSDVEAAEARDRARWRRWRRIWVVTVSRCFCGSCGNAHAGQTRVGVAVQSVAGDGLLTEVSTVGVP